MKKQHLMTVVFAAGMAAAYAGTPTYSYLRTIDLGTTVTTPTFRATTAIADSTGKLYVTSNFSDSVGYFDPLTATSAADIQVVYDATTPADPFGASSFMGITISGTDIYASGTNVTVGPTATYLLHTQMTGVGVWTNNFVTGITTVNGGCSTAGSGVVGFGDFFTGAARSYFVSPLNAATQLGSDVPAGGVADVIKVVGDTTTQKGYQSIVGPNLAGRVDTINSVSAYPTAQNPLIAPVSSTYTNTAQQLHYQQISVDPGDQVLCLSMNRGTDGYMNTFKLYDLTQTGPNISSYQTINGAGTTEDIFGANAVCYGNAFFTQNGQKYLFLMLSNQTGMFTGLVFQKNAAEVDNWHIY